MDKVQGKKALLSGPSGQGNPGMGVQDIRGVCLWIYHGILTLMGGEDSLIVRSQKSSATLFIMQAFLSLGQKWYQDHGYHFGFESLNS